MEATSRCLGACRSLGPFVCRFDRYLISSRALSAKGSKKFRDQRVGVLKSPSTLLAGEIPFSGRGRMDVIRNSSSLGRPRCFLSDSSPPIGNRLSRDLGCLQRGHALFSTSTSDMAARMSVGGAGNKIQTDVAKKESADKHITDKKILYSLAKYLWLKDNLEFRFRVVMALGLLVGAKVRTKLMCVLSFTSFFFCQFFYAGVTNKYFIGKFYYAGLCKGLANMLLVK